MSFSKIDAPLRFPLSRRDFYRSLLSNQRWQSRLQWPILYMVNLLSFPTGRAVACTANPLRAPEVKELGQRIQKTLAALPEEYRLLLLLVADERLSYEEMAVLTEQSADAVRGKLHRARKAFIAHFHKSA